MSALRYLESGKVTLPSTIPRFVEEGHCRSCNKPLTGKATKYCKWTKGSIYSNVSDCAAFFLDYWYSRPAFIRAIFIRDNFTCQICGYHQMLEARPWLPDMSNLECDHIIPLSRGGVTSMENLQTLCRPCNRKKGISIEGEEVQDLPGVIPSRDNGRCPACGSNGHKKLPWEVPLGYDPEMAKLVCLHCGESSYKAPRLRLVKVRV